MFSRGAKDVAVEAPNWDPACAAAELIGLGIAHLAFDGSWLLVNQRLCDLLGFSQDQLLKTSCQQFFDFPELRPDTRERQRLLGGEISVSTADNCFLRDGAPPICVRGALTVVRDERTKTNKHLILFVQQTTASDASHREVAQRIMRIQEAERSRIARELHDDIGQSLAILSVQMERAGSPVSGEPNRRHATVQELSQKAQSIAARVSQLSHKLYSSKLEYVGLAKTVRGECREFSQEHRIRVDFCCGELSGEWDSDIGLSFLRVLQEALHNIAKHSHATHVNVELSGNERELRLMVRDNGKGFNAQEARLASGIGLISMRERVELVGGEFEISSSPGQGTQIVARVAGGNHAKSL